MAIPKNEPFSNDRQAEVISSGRIIKIADFIIGTGIRLQAEKNSSDMNQVKDEFPASNLSVYVQNRRQNKTKLTSQTAALQTLWGNVRVRSFGVIWFRISDPRSPGSWCIKGTDKPTLVTDSSVPLMNYDPSDLGSLILIQIQIIPKERTLTSVIIWLRKYLHCDLLRAGSEFIVDF